MSLTDTILEQIEDYQMEQFAVEANVIEAHMEACMRNIIIQDECEKAGIVMEAEGSIFPERGDENIFKYIFFFIPRLVINIFKKIKEWWEKTTNKIREDAEKKATDAQFVQVKIQMDAVCAEVNRNIRGGGHLSYSGTNFVYLSRIKNPTIIFETYGMFCERFIKYRDCVKAFIEKTGDGDQINPDHTRNYVITELEAGAPKESDLCYEDYVIPIQEEWYNKEYLKNVKNINKKGSEVTRAMKDIEDEYARVNAAKNLSDANKALAREYMSLVHNICAVFDRFWAVVGDDMPKAGQAFNFKNQIIEHERERFMNQVTDQQKPDLEEKLNKWGVKKYGD